MWPILVVTGSIIATIIGLLSVGMIFCYAIIRGKK